MLRKRAGPCECGYPAECTTITVAKPAVKNHLKNHCDYEDACRPEVVDPCHPDSPFLPVIGTEGDVQLETEGRFTATTKGDAGFGNLVFGLPSGTTLGRLATMEAGFDFATVTTCGGGSPRFVVFLNNGRCPYAVFPTDTNGTCDAVGTTGNLIGNNTAYV